MAETPIGLVDGINPAFVLTNIPLAGTLLLFVNGLLQIADYTSVALAIVFNSDSVPHTGDVIFAQYRF